VDKIAYAGPPGATNINPITVMKNYRSAILGALAAIAAFAQVAVAATFPVDHTDGVTWTYAVDLWGYDEVSYVGNVVQFEANPGDILKYDPDDPTLPYRTGWYKLGSPKAKIWIVRVPYEVPFPGVGQMWKGLTPGFMPFEKHGIEVLFEGVGEVHYQYRFWEPKWMPGRLPATGEEELAQSTAVLSSPDGRISGKLVCIWMVRDKLPFRYNLEFKPMGWDVHMNKADLADLFGL
jgi:hypothetical protein